MGMETSIAGRIAVYVDSQGGRSSCAVVRGLPGGRVEVQGRGNAAGATWTCSPASLELIPNEWVARYPAVYR